jgi:tight adherence protein C
MGSALLYLGAASIGLGLVVSVAVGLSEKPGTTGVARSLAMITVGPARRTDLPTQDLQAKDRILTPLLGLTRGLALRLSPAGTTQRLTRLLDRAGNPAAWTVERLLGAKGAAMLGLALVALLLGGGISVRGLILAAGGGALGFFLPDLILYNAGVKRQDELRRGLADALDMLTVCVEAGQGFDAALQQVAKATSGPVAGEFARLLQEIQIGKARHEAMAALARRTDVPEIRAFVTALTQADRMGLPIGRVLREQSQQMRLVRRQRAEELAQKVPVKILFPMLLCIFPVLFLVVIGPGAIRMIQLFTRM